MSDTYDFPERLIQAQRAFWAATDAVEQLCRELPPSLQMTDEQRTQLAEVRSAQMAALETLYQDEWWGGTGQRHDRQVALRKAAREES
ncbi:hypothetical protein [Streptosporangium jomthongense]|uniref:Uncharacterized protein n=1 Tax=Streptosporangium jomthongense TaxID=1193683 RepID=A0ABV8FDM0_9ACTN